MRVSPGNRLWSPAPPVPPDASPRRPHRRPRAALRALIDNPHGTVYTRKQVSNPMTRPCPTAHCPNLQPCNRHAHGPFANAHRSTTLYHTPQWQEIRRRQLALEPRCRSCGGVATVADHVIPHRGSEAAFWAGVLQSLCKRCSNVKTGREAAIVSRNRQVV